MVKESYTCSTSTSDGASPAIRNAASPEAKDPGRSRSSTPVMDAFVVDSP